VEAAGTNERISQACREVYSQIQDELREKLVWCGLSESEASERASLTFASLEGSIQISRVQRRADPLRLLADHLRDSLSQNATS
jgi:TetR/AcrR family transcriptional repressor of lmrAB and yxaGH operons